MYSSESCRAQMTECKNLLSSAENQAETTVLNLLVRNWRNIAGQTDRYKELVRNRPEEQTSERVRHLGWSPRS
jgi:hypothetical protein